MSNSTRKHSTIIAYMEVRTIVLAALLAERRSMDLRVAAVEERAQRVAAAIVESVVEPLIDD